MMATVLSRMWREPTVTGSEKPEPVQQRSSAYHSMVVKQKAGTVEDMLEAVDEADLVLLEGGKNWDFPKIELVRKGNSERLVGNGRNLLAVATDIEGFQVEKAALGTCGTVSEDGSEVPVIALDDYKKAADLILELLAGGQEAQP